MSDEIVRVSMDAVKKVNKTYKGILNDFKLAGAYAVEGGFVLEMTREVFEKVQEGHRLGKAGTLLHNILAPGVSLFDAVSGTNLKGCGGCGGRELKMNAATGKKLD